MLEHGNGLFGINLYSKGSKLITMNYRAEIDGLRALAVIPVILFHAGFEWFSGGYVGVDVFFVISGYLITTIIISEINNETFSIINFYERRARRILPALFFVILACLPFAWLWLIPSDFKDFGQSLVAVSTFTSNIFFWFESGYFDRAAEVKPLLHTWSLAVEEQYYLLFPILLVLLWRLGVKWILFLLVIIFVASLSLAQWGATNQPVATFYLLTTRGWELLLGAFVAFYLYYNNYFQSFMVNQTLSLLGLFLIVYSIIVFDESTPFPGLYTLVPTSGTALLIIAAVPNTLSNKLLSFSPMVSLGLISYSAYLWHQPILAFARHRLLGELSDTLLIVLCLCAIVCAYISWRWIEKPFRKKGKIGRKAIFVGAVTSILGFTSIGLLIHVNNGIAMRFTPEVSVLDSIRVTPIRSTRACETMLSTGSDESILQNCSIGTQNQKPSFVVIGDSHARALIPAFDEYAKTIGMSGLNLSHSSCFPSFSDGYFLPFDDTQKKCIKWRKKLLSMIENRTLPETIYIAARWTLSFERGRFNNKEGGEEPGAEVIYNNQYMGTLNYQDSLARELSEAFALYKDNNYKVTLIYPIPEAGWDPLNMTIKQLIFNKNTILDENYASTSYAVFHDRNKNTIEILDKLASEYSFIKFKPHRYFCQQSMSNGRCITIKNNRPLYYDDDHISLYGGRILIDKLFQRQN